MTNQGFGSATAVLPWFAEDIVARPERHIPSSLEDAVAELKRDPRRPVHARVDELEVEIRVVKKSAATGVGLGDLTGNLVVPERPQVRSLRPSTGHRYGTAG